MDTNERNAVRTGDLVTAARCALARGDRAAAIAALATRACPAATTHDGRHVVDCVVVARVREDLCDLLPPPRVGAWRRQAVSRLDNGAHKALPARQPKLTHADYCAIGRAVAAYRTQLAA